MASFWRRRRLRPALAFAGLVAATACLVLVYTAAYSPELEWLRRSRDASLFVRPGAQTALLRPRAGLCATAGSWERGPLLLLAVPSAVGRRRRRDAVRHTWGRREPADTRLLFVLGHQGAGVPPEIAEEAAEHGDILVEDFLDTYHNLTLKTLFILKWAVAHCPTATYLLKVDDDVLVNVHGVSRLLSAAAGRGWGLVGRVFHGRPHRWRLPHPQWYLPRWLHPEPALPDYLTGPSYAVAGWALPQLLRAALRTPLLPLEDVLATGLAADAARLARHHVAGLVAEPSPLRLTRPCLARAALSTGGLSARELRLVWDVATRPPEGICWLLHRLHIVRQERDW